MLSNYIATAKSTVAFTPLWYNRTQPTPNFAGNVFTDLRNPQAVEVWRVVTSVTDVHTEGVNIECNRSTEESPDYFHFLFGV